MLQHATYTFQMVRHMPGPENRQIDYISGTSQRRIHILVSTHIFSRMRNPIKALLSVFDYYIILKHIQNNLRWSTICQNYNSSDVHTYLEFELYFFNIKSY